MTDETSSQTTETETKVPTAGSSQFLYMFMMMFVMIIMFIPTLRLLLASIVGLLLDPLITFNYSFPIFTIFCAALCMGIITTVVRHKFIDWIQMAKTNNKMKAFNKLYREIYMSKNQAKIDKVKKMRSKMTTEHMEISTSQMKPTMMTMILVIAVFSWVWFFIAILDNAYIAVPWHSAVNLETSTLLPNWILLYSLCSIPFALLVQYIMKIYDFSKRLNVEVEE